MGPRSFEALAFLIFAWFHTSKGRGVKNDDAPDGTADVFRVTVEVVGNPLFPCLFHDRPIIKALSCLPPVYTDQRTLGPSLRCRLKRSFCEKVKWRNAFTPPRSHVTTSVFCSVKLLTVGFGAANCRFILLGIIQPPQKKENLDHKCKSLIGCSHFKAWIRRHVHASATLLRRLKVPEPAVQNARISVRKILK